MEVLTMATAKPPMKAASAPMSKAEAQARAQAKEKKMQEATDKAYEASRTTGYKNGGLVKMSPKATAYKCGGKVK